MITDAFKKEISKFDLERVLPAWDGLISRQQQELAQLSVPTMFLTSDSDDRKVFLISLQSLKYNLIACQAPATSCRAFVFPPRTYGDLTLDGYGDGAQRGNCERT